MKTLLVSAFFFSALLIHLGTQTSSAVSMKNTSVVQIPAPDTTIYATDIVTELANFKHGMDSLMKFTFQQMDYPVEAMDAGVAGMLMVFFVVEIDGTVSNLEIGKSKLGYGCEEAAIAIVIKSSGMWIPARIDKRPVRSEMFLPISFYKADPKESIIIKH